MSRLKSEMAATLLFTASVGMAGAQLEETKVVKEMEAFNLNGITYNLDSSIPKLETYDNEEIFHKIILPLFARYSESVWFADDKVAMTQEAAGQKQKPGWTEKLIATTPPLIKKGKGKYIELERMLSSVVFFNLFLCKECDELKTEQERLTALEKAYQKFICLQKRDEQLSFKNFLELHALARKVAKTKESYETVVLMLVMSDVGKTPEAKKRAFEAGLLRPDHDDFIEELLAFPEDEKEKKEKLEKIAKVLLSFQKVPEATQVFLQKAASAMKIHLGHVYHIEGGQRMFAKFEEAVRKGAVRPEIFDFAILIHLSDVAASAAHIDFNGSLALNENAYQGYRLVGEALSVIQQGGNAKGALQLFLKKRGELLGLSVDTPIQRVLVRLACMMRFFSREEGALLNEALKNISDSQQKILIEQFGLEENEIGLNAWKRNPTYVPAVLVNLLQLQKTEEPKHVKIARALDGAVCIAAILQKYADKPENRNAENPLNFNAYAGIAASKPHFLSSKHFNVDYINFDNGNVSLDSKAQIDYSAIIEAKETKQAKDAKESEHQSFASSKPG